MYSSLVVLKTIYASYRSVLLGLGHEVLFSVHFLLLVDGDWNQDVPSFVPLEDLLDRLRNSIWLTKLSI